PVTSPLLTTRQGRISIQNSARRLAGILLSLSGRTIRQFFAVPCNNSKPKTLVQSRCLAYAWVVVCFRWFKPLASVANTPPCLQNAEAALQSAKSGYLTSTCGLLGALSTRCRGNRTTKLPPRNRFSSFAAANNIEAVIGCP